MELEVFLSFFTLMLVALGVNVIALKTRLPYTVLLVIAGSLMVPLSSIEILSFINRFQLTPELLFFVFLPILIFESAYSMNVRNVKDNKLSMSVLAVLGLLISTFFIGYVGKWVFSLLGFEVPLLVTLLFGAIISATDPVAVLALFKEYGAPHRLTLIFEGESLFNDGTSFALFLVFLDLITHGYHGYTTVLSGIFSFTTMIVGGVIFGLLMGFMFSKMIQWVKGHEHLEITLTLLVAHLTFLLTELISEHLVIYGHEIHLSSIIATLVSSMVIGNFGRFKMSSGVEEYMEKFWSYFAFLSNSLVFILMGLLFTSLSSKLHIAILPILAMILIVAMGRWVSVYFSVGLINKLRWEDEIPTSWRKLLAWGSLRGSIAVIMALLIPDNLTLPDWHHSISIKDFIIAITIGSIYFTLFVKATTIGFVVRKLGIDALTANEEMSYYKSKALVYDNIVKKIDELYQHKHISDIQHQELSSIYQTLQTQSSQKCHETGDASRLIENMLRLYTLGLEKAELKEVFRRGEINDNVYKEILNVLETQTERVKSDDKKVKAITKHFSNWRTGRVMSLLRKLFFLPPAATEPEELYIYYRTQYKLLLGTMGHLSSLENSKLRELFDDERALNSVKGIYQYLVKQTEKHMHNEIQSNQAFVDRFNKQSAESILHKVQQDTLNELHKKEIITSKLYISLKKELNA